MKATLAVRGQRSMLQCVGRWARVSSKLIMTRTQSHEWTVSTRLEAGCQLFDSPCEYSLDTPLLLRVFRHLIRRLVLHWKHSTTPFEPSIPSRTRRSPCSVTCAPRSLGALSSATCWRQRFRARSTARHECAMLLPSKRFEPSAITLRRARGLATPAAACSSCELYNSCQSPSLASL